MSNLFLYQSSTNLTEVGEGGGEEREYRQKEGIKYGTELSSLNLT